MMVKAIPGGLVVTELLVGHWGADRGGEDRADSHPEGRSSFPNRFLARDGVVAIRFGASGFI